MAPPPDTHQPVIASYLTLRRVVGVLGGSLPVVLALWGFSLLGGFRILPVDQRLLRDHKTVKIS